MPPRPPAATPPPAAAITTADQHQPEHRRAPATPAAGTGGTSRYPRRRPITTAPRPAAPGPPPAPPRPGGSNPRARSTTPARPGTSRTAPAHTRSRSRGSGSCRRSRVRAVQQLRHDPRRPRRRLRRSAPPRCTTPDPAKSALVVGPQHLPIGHMTPPPARRAQPPPETPLRPPPATARRPRLPRLQRRPHAADRVHMTQPAQRRPVRPRTAARTHPGRPGSASTTPAPDPAARLRQPRPPPPRMQLPHHLRRRPQQRAEQIRADPVHLPAPHQRRYIPAGQPHHARVRPWGPVTTLSSAACSPPLTHPIMPALAAAHPLRSRDDQRHWPAKKVEVRLGREMASARALRNVSQNDAVRSRSYFKCRA